MPDTVNDVYTISIATPPSLPPPPPPPPTHTRTVHMALVGYFIVFSFVTKPGQTLEFLLWGTIVPLNFLVGYYCSIVASTPQPMAYAFTHTHTVHMALVGYFIVFSFVTKPGQTLEFLLWGTIVPLNSLVGYHCSIVASTPQPMAYASTPTTHILKNASLWRLLLFFPLFLYLRTSHRLCTQNCLWSTPVFRIPLWRPFVFPFLFCPRSPQDTEYQPIFMQGDCGVPHCPFYCPCSKEFPCGVGGGGHCTYWNSLEGSLIYCCKDPTTYHKHVQSWVRRKLRTSYCSPLLFPLLLDFLGISH